MRNLKHYILFGVALSFWATICFVLPDFLDNPVSSFSVGVHVAIYVIAIGIMNMLILLAMALNRYVFAVLLIPYAVLGAIISYYRVAYHATITPAVIDATLHTNLGTIAGVVSWQLVFYILFNLLITIAFINWRFRLPIDEKWSKHSYKLIVFLLLFLFSCGYYGIDARLNKALNQRYPMNVLYSMTEYFHFLNERGSDKLLTDVSYDFYPDSLNVIVILGESTRADHLSLNGYHRQTMPRLENNENVVSLPNIYSQYSYTAASVPHIFTCADSVSPELAYLRHSFIVNYKQHGYFSAWISNQDYGRTYMTFIQETDTAIFPNASKSVFVYDTWNDMELLPYLDSLIIRKSNKNLYILHTIGSHWYYNLHVPDSLLQYLPLTNNRVITSNTVEQVVNSYDNTILAIDVFLDELTHRFKDTPAILLYISDHGESLGEEGHFLHANYEETKYPAALVWYSDKYETMYPEKIKALKRNRIRRYRTDYFFPSVLSAAGMCYEQQKDLDIFSTLSIDE